MNAQARLTSLNLLRELIAFPSVSLTPNVALIQRVHEVLHEAGIEAEIVADPKDATRCNLFASVGPQGVPGIMLSGHTDVVPVTGQPWTMPPFEATEHDGRIYGRGSADMKGFVACAVAALVRAASLPLKRPLQIALSFDEEIGCVGVRHLLPVLVGRIAAPTLCIVGEPTLMQIGTGHKGKTAYRAVCCGQAGHSGLAPRFANAIHTAADLIVAVRDVQQELAESGPREEGFAVGYSTVHAGTIHGGTALNIVPDRCEINFEVRTVSEDDPDAIVARVLERTSKCMRRAPPSVERSAPVVEQVNGYPGLRSDDDREAIAFLADRLPAGTACTKVDYGSEGGLFKKSWSTMPVLVCGPGSIGVAHKADEYVQISQLEACERLLSAVADSLRS
jgi:acetylornithine deacetylase